MDYEIKISNHEAIFELDQVGKFGGSYKGLFKLRTCLTPLQEIQADRDFRFLVGENVKDAAPKVLNLAYALAQLKQRVIEAPPFWNQGEQFGGASVKDHEIIETIFQVAFQAEEKYKKLLLEKELKSAERLKEHIKQRVEEEKINEELK